MFVLADRVKQNSVTTGTGDVVFSNTLDSFQSFADAIGDGNSTYYTIEGYKSFEIGIGTYSSATNSLSRDVVLVSSDGTNKINLDGVSNVFVTYPAAKHVILDSSGYIQSYSSDFSGIKFPDGTTQATAAGSSRSHTSVNSDKTLSISNDLVIISTLSNNITLTLPTASSMSGRTLTFKFNSNQFQCTISSQPSETIDQESTYVLRYNKESISCFSDGNNWNIL